MRKTLLWLLVVLMVVTLFLPGCNKEGPGGAVKPDTEGEKDPSEKVTITLTSWRTEDIERTNALNAIFMDQHKNIEVDFQPISDQEYDGKLVASLQSGVGADIIWLRSYDPGRIIYDGGYLSDLNDILPELKNWPSSAVEAWSTDDGIIYGVPVAGVTHGVFYRKSIFDKYDLKEPETWDEFINVCQVLKDNGETVFAQGTVEGWPLYEVIYSGLGANFYGGEESRQKLMAGEMKLTDAPFVKAFEKAKELQPFFPNGHEAIYYPDMQQMFGNGLAAMYIGGSWEISLFEDSGLTDLAWFAPPVETKGDRLQYCFHVDMGIGINKNSKNYEAALEYLKWATTQEFAQAFMEQLPGFYSYTPGEYKLESPVAQKIIDAAADEDVTVRTVWQNMSRQDPSGNGMMEEALVRMYTENLPPADAAKLVQDALETWYEPFMN